MPKDRRARLTRGPALEASARNTAATATLLAQRAQQFFPPDDELPLIG